LVIDVDGRAAHDVLLQRLGGEPRAPQVQSGSGDPYRYHLYFRHPVGMNTKAKATPWHPQLEFRGQGGYVVLPPSLHKSGQRYTWVAGRTLDDLSLPEVPALIRAALQEQAQPKRPATGTGQRVLTKGVRKELLAQLPEVSASTQAFLAGQYANGPQWNDRLFQAACDLEGQGVSADIATPLLLDGARPWTRDDKQQAQATIDSAFSRPRVPNRK